MGNGYELYFVTNPIIGAKLYEAGISVTQRITDNNVTTYTWNKSQFGTVTPGFGFTVYLAHINESGIAIPIISTGCSNLPLESGAPNAVQNLNAVVTGQNVALTWDAPNGGPEFSQYQMAVASRALPAWNTYSPSQTSSNIANMPVGDNCLIVRAVTASGISGAPTAVVASVSAPTTEPRNLTATPGNGTATLTWVAPQNINNSAITKYEVSSDGTNWVDKLPTELSHTFTGLTNGQEHTLRVRAVNGAGTSVEATIPTTPDVAPCCAPENITVVAGDTTATVTWSAPMVENGGSIWGYKIRLGEGAWVTLPSTARTYTFENLENGVEYVISLLAYNSAGEGLIDIIEVTPQAPPCECTGPEDCDCDGCDCGNCNPIIDGGENGGASVGGGGKVGGGDNKGNPELIIAAIVLLLVAMASAGVGAWFGIRSRKKI